MESKKYKTDKIENGLIDEYVAEFQHLKKQRMKLLEIGIDKGGSLLFWADFLEHPESQVIGIDLVVPSNSFPEKITMFQCNQRNRKGLKEIADKYGPFNIIIDDGSHCRKETKRCFNVLFNYVVTEGYYVIEDWAVGYWKKPENPGYRGMVGVITKIIQKAPELKIQSLKIILEPHKTMAFFKKGVEGWKE